MHIGVFISYPHASSLDHYIIHLYLPRASSHTTYSYSDPHPPSFIHTAKLVDINTCLIPTRPHLSTTSPGLVVGELEAANSSKPCHKPDHPSRGVGVFIWLRFGGDHEPPILPSLSRFSKIYFYTSSPSSTFSPPAPILPPLLITQRHDGW